MLYHWLLTFFQQICYHHLLLSDLFTGFLSTALLSSYTLVNTRRACAASVTVVVLCECMYVCMCVCVCVHSYLPPHTLESQKKIQTNSAQYRDRFKFFANFPKNASFKSYGVICLPRAAPAS